MTVEDDGPGVPTHDVSGVPFVQRALTEFHRTPTLDGHAPHAHLALHGVGIVAVNALSEWLLVDVFQRQRCTIGTVSVAPSFHAV